MVGEEQTEESNIRNTRETTKNKIEIPKQKTKRKDEIGG